MDLHASRVHVEVVPDDSDDLFARLDAFVASCNAESVVDVRLHYRKGVSRHDRKRFQNYTSMKRLPSPTVWTGKVRASGDRRGYPRFHCESIPARRRSSRRDSDIGYRLRVDGGLETVEHLHKAVRLIGSSLDLDARSALQLRLCVYELATNTAEHATFNTASPEICVDLVFTARHVAVVYRDNSAAFLTAGPVTDGVVEERIHTNSKRGLGLYLLNKLCTEFRYQREDDWNVTSFSLEIDRNWTSTVVR
jgi:anti-sigma regulatory factor (Ser/Thr protein kinase)